MTGDDRTLTHIDASGEPLTYFRDLIADVANRSERAVTQRHVFTVCRLALHAQDRAVRLPIGGTEAK